MQEEKRIIKEFEHYQKAIRYSKRENCMRFFMLMVALSVLGIIISIVIKKFIVLYICIFGYFAFLIIGFLTLQLFMRYRNKVISCFECNDFDDYINNLTILYNALVADVFSYGVWNYIKNNSILREMYTSGEYADEKYNSAPKRDFLIVSFFRCITYQYNDRAYRIPELFRSENKMKDVLNRYYNIYVLMDNHNRTDFFMLLKDSEDCYSSERKEAKDKGLSLGSNGGMVESFTVFSNEEPKLFAIKNLIAFSALFAMVIHFFFYNISDVNQIATFLFEGITVFLLFVDVRKDKDKDADYLH